MLSSLSSSLSSRAPVQAYEFHPYGSQWLVDRFDDKPLSLRLPSFPKLFGSISKLAGLNTGNRERKLENPLVEPQA